MAKFTYKFGSKKKPVYWAVFRRRENGIHHYVALPVDARERPWWNPKYSWGLSALRDEREEWRCQIEGSAKPIRVDVTKPRCRLAPKPIFWSTKASDDREYAVPSEDAGLEEAVLAYASRGD
jgi:hypothetical protein